jgi:hypothetical protein
MPRQLTPQKVPAACVFIVLPYVLDVRTFTVRFTHAHERRFGRKITGNFADNGDFHDIAGIFYMPQICDIGPMTLLPLRRKAR